MHGNIFPQLFFIFQQQLQIGKNLYAWHGTTHQRMTLARLRQIGIKFDMLQRYLAVKAEEQTGGGGVSLSGGGITPTNHTCHGLVSPMGGYVSSLSDSVVSTPASSVCNSSISSCSPSLTPSSGLGASPSPSPSPSGPTERKTSLGKACQRFLMLFLVLPEVSLSSTHFEILSVHYFPTKKIFVI